MLFAGNDALARQAVDLIEELARKGRSYGLHLVLASQSTTGVEALYGRAEAIFGQFPLRIALPGGDAVLDPRNDAARGLTVGTAVVNTGAGAPGSDAEVRFPDAHAASADLAALRHELHASRPAGARPPAVFRGHETPRLTDDPAWAALTPGTDPPYALVGRVVDVPGSPAGFALDASPGRHLAVVGTSAAGADLPGRPPVPARQHAPGTARFLFAPLAPGTTDAADDLAMTLAAAGHPVRRLDAGSAARPVRRGRDRRRPGDRAHLPGGVRDGRRRDDAGRLRPGDVPLRVRRPARRAAPGPRARGARARLVARAAPPHRRPRRQRAPRRRDRPGRAERPRRRPGPAPRRARPGVRPARGARPAGGPARAPHRADRAVRHRGDPS
ncbi:TraM recognition domain-containing protein [Micromonospora sp. BRA006-A]|nr:TraM recognition domain-containing protein [Micromonospora sp. BRA006-A]